MKKVLLSILSILIFLIIICIGLYFFHDKQIAKYSSYCINAIRIQLGDDIGNISNNYIGRTYAGRFLYSGNVTSDGKDYIYQCGVLLKNNAVDLELQEGSLNEGDEKQEPKIATIEELKETFTGNSIDGTELKEIDITGDNILYFNDKFGFAVVLGSIWSGGNIKLETHNEQRGENAISRQIQFTQKGFEYDNYSLSIDKNDRYDNMKKQEVFWTEEEFEKGIKGKNNKYFFMGYNNEQLAPYLDTSDDIDSNLFPYGFIFYDVEEGESTTDTKENGKYGINYQFQTFDELKDVIAMCPYETLGGGYDEYPVYKREFILPYGDGYIGYNYGGNNGEGWGYYLTYKSLDNPCEVISSSDEFFFRYFNDRTHYMNPEEPIRADNKVFLGLGGTALDVVEKELDCEMGKDINDDDTCQKEMNKYMYDLVIGKEENDYFIKWMNFLKKSIDTKNYITLYDWNNIVHTCYETNTWSNLLEEYGEDNKNLTEDHREEYRKKHLRMIRECVDSFIE